MTEVIGLRATMLRAITLILVSYAVIDLAMLQFKFTGLPGVLTATGLAVLAIGLTLLHQLRQPPADTAVPEELSPRDRLTGALTHGFFENMVSNDLPSLAHTGRRAAMLVIEIDNIAEVQSHLGHRVVDILSAHLGRRLLCLTRRTDGLARVGIAQFALWLKDADMDQAQHVATKLIEAIGKSPVSMGHGGLVKAMEASAGIALFEPNEAIDETVPVVLEVSAERLLHEARAGLAQARLMEDGPRVARADRVVGELCPVPVTSQHASLDELFREPLSA